MNSRKVFFSCMVVLAALTLTAVAANAAPQSCGSLMSIKLPDTTITAVTSEPAGPFTPPGENGRQGRPMDLPAFCRVEFTVAANNKMEVWMPASGWNGDFEGVGGGGFAGSISYPAMAAALKAGYATASTDTGHQGNDASFALGHPDAVVDFAYRSIHEMTVKSKQFIEALYGTGPKESYFTGCSQGGRQGITEAQRYPDDYNGIVSGAPAVNHSHLMVNNLTVGLDTVKDPGSYIPPSKLPAIQEAAMVQCDALDGLKDGLISDPRPCKFDPAVLLCKEAENDQCLTQKQIDALQKLYAGAVDDKGKLIYPGREPGAESGWRNFLTGPEPGKGSLYNFGVSYMKYFVFNDPNWDYKTWDFAKDMPKVDDPKVQGMLDSLNPDLKAFRDHGDKLIIYQGWGDEAVSPLYTIQFYKSIVAKMTGVGKGTDANSPEDAKWDEASAKTGDFLRLFMVPGMDHCFGGPGPNVFDSMAAISNWVEKKEAPEKIIASHMTKGAVDRTRPLCPYPQTAQYSGSGSIDDAANFSCKMPTVAK